MSPINFVHRLEAIRTYPHSTPGELYTGTRKFHVRVHVQVYVPCTPPPLTLTLTLRCLYLPFSFSLPLSILTYSYLPYVHVYDGCIHSLDWTTGLDYWTHIWPQSVNKKWSFCTVWHSQNALFWLGRHLQSTYMYMYLLSLRLFSP